MLCHGNTSLRLSENRAFDSDGSVRGAVSVPVLFLGNTCTIKQVSKRRAKFILHAGAQTFHISFIL